VDISGWKIQYKAATGASYLPKSTLPASSTIAAHGYFLIASNTYAGSVAADYKLTGDLNMSATNSGHVRLGQPAMGTAIIDANVVDTVGYGSTADSPEGTVASAPPASPGSIERKAQASSTSASMDSGGADVTAGNGFDSNNNGADFVTRATRDPQNQASAVEP
jgi:hypothetical protein